jgi:iron(III) transport system substrate-binding protein
VPAEASSPKGDWVAVSARPAAFAYNPSKLTAADVPTSVLDLASPSWQGKIGISPGETDFAPVVTRVINAKGSAAAKTWLEGLKTNSKLYDSNEDLIAAIGRGEIASGVIDHYYWYRYRQENGGTIPVVLSYFPKSDAGALVDVSGAAVLTSSSHPAAAQAFLAYLVSDSAQQIIASSQSYEYPLL